MPRSKEDIKSYFSEIFFNLMYQELERCIKNDIRYVAALALLSYTEYIGGLISGNLGLKDKSKDNFYEALMYFPQEYRTIDANLKIEYVDEKGAKCTDEGIYSLVRCGVVHEYFLKGVATGVINHQDGQTQPDHIGIVVTTGPEKFLIFRTNEYFRDFKSAVDKIYKKLIVEYDPDLLKKFNASLDRIFLRRIL
jgi:hypothetical protein